MAQTNDLDILLEMLPDPAFAASEGRITHCNTKARNLFLFPGQELAPLLGSGAEALENLTSDALELNLNLSDLPCSAIATPMESCVLFRLDPYHTTPELKGMSLLANLVRMPVCDALYAAQRLEKGSATEELSILQHSLYKVLRILTNTSNAERFCAEGKANHQMIDVTAVAEEILTEAARLLESAQLTLKWSVPSKPILTAMNSDALLHTLYNLIGNAAKASKPGDTVEVSVSSSGNQIRITVADHGEGIPDEILTNLFTQYARHTEFYNGVWGMGLGMLIARTFAENHDGTVFVERKKQGGTRITVTATICQDISAVQNNLATIAPPAHESLTLLSEVLPYGMFPPEN